MLSIGYQQCVQLELLSKEVDVEGQLNDRVRGVIAKTLRRPLDEIHLRSSFSDLGMDSLDAMNLLFALEEEFDISIADNDAKLICSVSAAAEGVRKLLEMEAVQRPSPGVLAE